MIKITMTDEAAEQYANRFKDEAGCFRGRRLTKHQVDMLLDSIRDMYHTISACEMTEEMENNNANKSTETNR